MLIYVHPYLRARVRRARTRRALREMFVAGLVAIHIHPDGTRRYGLTDDGWSVVMEMRDE